MNGLTPGPFLFRERPDFVWAVIASLYVGNVILLVLNLPLVGRWVQLGGHCEPADITIAGAALREAREESGIADLQIDPAPVHLDIHPITCSLGHPTRHFDVRFRIVAPTGAVPVMSDESVDLRFFPVDHLPAGVDGGVRAAVTAALARH